MAAALVIGLVLLLGALLTLPFALLLALYLLRNGSRRRLAKPLLLALAIASPGLAQAQFLVNQGQGSAPSAAPWRVITAAQGAGKTTECLVTNSAGGTVCPATPLAGRRFVELQNLGANPIYCTADGSTPVVSKARRIAALPASGPADSWQLAAGPGIVITCIAATAAQATGAATVITELS